MNKPLQVLFWNIMSWGLDPAVASVFHGIQKKQANNQNIPYQFPEPWNGDIENAPLIFVGLNPSFTPDEVFPCDDSQEKSPWWTTQNAANSIKINGISLNKQRIEDFFENRFFTAKYSSGKEYINKKLGVLLHNGRYGNPVRYLKFLEKVMQFELKNLNATMGKDCALLEIFPCKSKRCEGLNKKIINNNGYSENIVNNFVNTHFKKLLDYLLNGKIGTRTFVVLGRMSAEAFYNIIKNIDSASAKPSPDFASDFDIVWRNRRLETLKASIFGKQIKVVLSYHSSAHNFSFGKYVNNRQP
ncbi:MAG: hypothetical protein IKH15_09865 [Bacteroidales bacterium]|nr:hypothetical protein [Bacteroidales bacterium]MBR4646440.1 hypothetical protein [Bacteroidales bacterium]